MATSLFQALGDLSADAGKGYVANRNYDLAQQQTASEIAARTAATALSKEQLELSKRRQSLEELGQSVKYKDPQTGQWKLYNPVSMKVSDLPAGYDPTYDPTKDPIAAIARLRKALPDMPEADFQQLAKRAAFTALTGKPLPFVARTNTYQTTDGTWMKEDLDQDGNVLWARPTASAGTATTQTTTESKDPVTGLVTTSTSTRKKVPNGAAPAAAAPGQSGPSATPGASNRPSITQAISNAKGNITAPAAAPQTTVAPNSAASPASTPGGAAPGVAGGPTDWTKLPSASRSVVQRYGDDLANGKVTTTTLNQQLKGKYANLIPFITEYAKSKGWSQTGLKDPDTLRTLNVLKNSLFTYDAKTPALDSTLAVLDNPVSRVKLAGLLRGSADEKQGGAKGMLERIGVAMASSALTQSEKNYLFQFRRAVSVIQGLRQFTGNARSTEAQINRFIAELPDPITTPSAADGKYKLGLVWNEIQSVLSGETMKGGANFQTPPSLGGPSGKAPTTADEYLQSIGAH